MLIDRLPWIVRWNLGVMRAKAMKTMINPHCSPRWRRIMLLMFDILKICDLKILFLWICCTFTKYPEVVFLLHPKEIKWLWLTSYTHFFGLHGLRLTLTTSPSKGIIDKLTFCLKFLFLESWGNVKSSILGFADPLRLPKLFLLMSICWISTPQSWLKAFRSSFLPFIWWYEGLVIMSLSVSFICRCGLGIPPDPLLPLFDPLNPCMRGSSLLRSVLATPGGTPRFWLLSWWFMGLVARCSMLAVFWKI